MTSITKALSDFVSNLVAFVLMIILAVISFFFVVFVVDIGAGMAGFEGNQYTVLSAALIVSAAIVAGGISPLSHLSGVEEPTTTRTAPTDD